MKVMTSLFFIVLLYRLGNSAKVAIIGKGFGAALCSYYLRQMIPKIEIDIYDHKSQFRNLMRTVVHSKYFYMNEIIQEKEFSTRPINMDDRPMINDDGQIVLYDATKLIANDPTGYLEVQEFVQQQLKNFEKIYQNLNDGKSFKTVQELLKSSSPEFEDYYINKTTFSLLEENIPASIIPGITKFVKAGLSCSCFADLNSHAYAGLDMLMFSEITGDEMLIMTKEEDVFKKLHKKRDNFIKKDILKIIHSYDDNMNYVVSNDNRQTDYDFVILSTNTAAQIKFEHFQKRVNIFDYVEGRITYVFGNLLEPFKGDLPCKSNGIINLDKNHMFIKGRNKNTFKINKKLMEASQNEILEYADPYLIQSFGKFDACPDYSKDKLVRNAKFELGENLYNAQALDCLSVTNEMHAISAKNIALLINQKISEKSTTQKIVGTTTPGPDVGPGPNPGPCSSKKSNKERKIISKKKKHTHKTS